MMPGPAVPEHKDSGFFAEGNRKKFVEMRFFQERQKVADWNRGADFWLGALPSEIAVMSFSFFMTRYISP